MNRSPDSRHIVIVGAGLAGALLATMLGRRGHRVDVYEARPDPRSGGFIGGRSINLALSHRGITALKTIGLADTVLAQSVPMRGRMMHDRAGKLTFQRYSRNEGEAIHSVSRGGLNILLLDAADACDCVDLHFNQRCEDVDVARREVRLIDEDTSGEHRVSADVIIGADGAFSALRSALQKLGRFNYSQDYLEHGYKELTIPPTDGGGFALEPGALHIWPRGGFMMIALPNIDCSFTCTCFWPFEAFERLQTREQIEDYFRDQFPDVLPHLPTLVEDFKTNPTSSLVTIRCEPWHVDGHVLVLGDAAHAIVPFFGQGMNAAFEDCDILMRQLDAHQGDWERVLPAFSESRKPDAEAIADLALDNFIEMRDKVASPAFLLRKRLDHLLHGVLPGMFTPLYNMVSFTSIPYAEARRRGRRQRHLVDLSLIAIAIGIFIALIALMNRIVT